MSLHKPTAERPHPLYDVATTRRIERAAQAALPPHALMQRAGLAVARLALAIAPHAGHIWIACGPGNNGGDGLEAARQLQRLGKRVTVSWLGDEARAPADALASYVTAQAAGVAFSTEPPAAWDLGIDALLGIGFKGLPRERMARWIAQLNAHPSPVLAVDLPSGLDADTGATPAASDAGSACVNASVTLSLLTLKPGLFTASGRDMAGEVWLDSLGVDPQALAAPNAPLKPGGALPTEPCAVLQGPPTPRPRTHASHKGSYGDVAVVGGAPGMAGAALLAASAALHSGAGRVFVGLLDDAAPAWDASQPELMFRSIESLDFDAMAVVCGCGGGTAVHAVLPRVLSTAPLAVLDADALNAIAQDSSLQALLQARAARQQATVLTPHPLEASRLLGLATGQVQADRLAAARQLAEHFACVAVLKGSGTVIAAPDQISAINPTGNARLATAGTGDVLAGMLGARLAALPDRASPADAAGVFKAACEAVYAHGALADAWPAGTALTAGLLARADHSPR